MIADPQHGETGGKIRTLDELKDILASRKAVGKTIVHCHGVFDLLHIGHIRHFEEAGKLGDLLVVTVTPDRYVNKGPHRPAFPDNLRAEAVAALGSVDFVAINEWPMATETIRSLRPDFYVKGSDYQNADDDHTGGISLEEEAVRSVGGRIVFTDDISYSSSALINRNMSTLPREVSEYLDTFSAKYSVGDVLGYLRNARDLKVMVVGEAIIDEYQYCDAIGKSSKEPTLAVKYRSSENFAGGALAVANHVAGFCDNVSLLTFLGNTNSQEEFVSGQLRANIDAKFLYRKDSPTIVKRRFVENYFFTKLLEVYEMNDETLVDDDDDQLCAALAERLPDFDLVLTLDFGHGMITPRAIKELCGKTPFLAVNAQSNAGNQGYHTISRYERADFVSLAENEVRLEARDRGGDLREAVLKISNRLGCKRAVVTRGKNGCLCFDKDEGFVEVPALAGQIVDRMGAGDAFLSVAALCVVQGAPIELAGFVGNAAGGQAVATVGHRASTEPALLYKHIESLLK